jgi:hypothetical protein
MGPDRKPARNSARVRSAQFELNNRALCLWHLAPVRFSLKTRSTPRGHRNTNAANSMSLRRIYFGGRPPNRATHAVIGTLRPTDRRRAANQFSKSSGAEGDRTPDLCSAIAALSQLSYSPARTRQTVLEPGSGRSVAPDQAKAPRNNAGPLLSEPSGSAPKVKTLMLSSGL